MTLLLCAHCARHINSSEASCPFCGESAANAKTSGHTTPGALSRTRAGLLLGAAALTGTIAIGGCSSSSSSSAFLPPYGLPPIDAGPAADGGADGSNGSADAGDAGD